MNMCFIDDEVSRNTLDVLLSLREYAKDKGIRVECELLAVAFDWKGIDEDTYNYFRGKYQEEKIHLERCDSEECLEKEIKARLQKEICFMIDLHLQNNEEERMDSQLEYECLSMKVLDWIAGETYHMYSLFTEDPYKDKWCKRFKQLYQREEPTIIEREKLQPGSFSRSIANEIMGVNNI